MAYDFNQQAEIRRECEGAPPAPPPSPSIIMLNIIATYPERFKPGMFMNGVWYDAKH